MQMEYLDIYLDGRGGIFLGVRSASELVGHFLANLGT